MCVLSVSASIGAPLPPRPCRVRDCARRCRKEGRGVDAPRARRADTQGKDAGKPTQRKLTIEAAMEQLELRSNRINELEDVVESVTFALDQVTRQRKLMLGKIAKMRLRMERLGTIAIAAAEAKADERAAREHKCSTDVTVTFDAGPIGLALTNAPEGYHFAMEIEGFTKVRGLRRAPQRHASSGTQVVPVARAACPRAIAPFGMQLAASGVVRRLWLWLLCP